MDASEYFCDKCGYIEEGCICNPIVNPPIKKEHCNEWSECCNAPALYFKCSDGILEPWDFCSECLECTSYYEADKPREVKNVK